MNNDDIKKLAKAVYYQKNIDPKLSKFIFENLNRVQLANFVRYLKILVNKEKVVIKSGTTISTTIKDNLKKRFADRNVEFIENDKNTVGISVKENDTIIDLSVSGMINQTVEQLKTNL